MDKEIEDMSYYYWVDNIYPFDVYSVKIGPIADEEVGFSNATFIGIDAIKAEITSLVRTKEFIENEYALLSEIKK